MNKKSKVTFAMLVYLAGTTAASEFAYADKGRNEGVHPYIGASYGRVDVDSDEFDDDSDTAYSFYGGVDLGPVFGVELGYVDFGGSENDFYSTDTDGVQLSGLVHFVNTDYLDVYARAGVLDWDTSVDTALGDASTDGTEMFWAVGTDIYLVQNAAIRIEYARYEVELEEDEAGFIAEGEEYNLNQISAGIKFTF